MGGAILGLLVAACAPAPERPPRMTRLGPTGVPGSLRFEDETRPVLLLSSGEVRSFRAQVEAGSRAVFALALLESAPERGFVHLELTVDGRTVFRDSVSVKRTAHWFHRSALLEGSGQVDVAFRTRHGRADGTPFPGDSGGRHPAEAAGAEPWIALSLPRLYRGEPREEDGRRVLVWISQDTVRADHLGAYGYERDTSPRFDERARDWALFEAATASSSWTLPSMTSQFLSRHPSHHGGVLHELQPQPGIPSLFEILAAEGFTVLGATGNDFVSSSYALERGFDVLYFREGRAQKLSRLLLRALDEWHGGDLALFAHLMDPHAPYTPPRPYRHLFHPQHPDAEPLTGVMVLPQITDPDTVDHVVALYDEDVAYTDAVIGDLLDALDARGLLEGAVIAYSADHGEEFRDHGNWSHGETLYQEVLHVPFAVRVPGLPPGRIADLVSLVDLAPTVLDAFDVAAPSTFQGRSLVPLIAAGGGLSGGRTVIAETHIDEHAGPLAAIRRGNLKVIVRSPPGGTTPRDVTDEMLFDLGSDPAETENVWGNGHGAPLASAALDFLERAEAEGARPRPVSTLSPEALARLRALGYVR